MHYTIDHAGFEYLDGDLIYPFGHREDPAYERIWERAWLDECQVAYETSGWVDPEDMMSHPRRRHEEARVTRNPRVARRLEMQMDRKAHGRCDCQHCIYDKWNEDQLHGTRSRGPEQSVVMFHDRGGVVRDAWYRRRTGSYDSWKRHRPYQAHGRCRMPKVVDVIDYLNGMYTERI